MSDDKQFSEEFENKKVKAGEVLNPKGRGRGFKNAKTLIKEFMDNKIETLKGTKVSRFQYMLWSMYEINIRLMKQLDYRKSEIVKAEQELEHITNLGKDGDGTILESPKKILTAERALRKRNTEYETLLRQVQESQGKLSEFLLKASGQFVNKQEIESKFQQPLLVTCGKDDLEAAMKEIDGEC